MDLRRQELERLLASRTKELSALNEIIAAVNQSLELNETLNQALEKTLLLMNVDHGGIYLLDNQNGALKIVVQRGFKPRDGYPQKCNFCWEVRKFLRPYFPETFGPAEVYETERER